MGSAADYKARLEPKEVEIEGDVWLVRRMTKAGHARHFSGLQLLVDIGGSGKPTAEQIEAMERINREVIEAHVLGIKNPETGVAEPVPYDALTVETFDALWSAIIDKKPNAREGEIRGAL